MSSHTPLNNAILQSSIDFNNQTVANAAGLSRYTIHNYGATNVVLSENDLNAVCIFSGNRHIDLPSGLSAAMGAEIILYSTDGFIRLDPDVGTTVYRERGLFSLGAGIALKLINAGTNEWILSGANFNSSAYAYTDCCSASETVYQLRMTDTFDYTINTYTDPELLIPFNGTVITTSGDPPASYYYNVINGVSSEIFGCDAEEYTTEYTLYNGAATPTTVYSVSGIDVTSAPSIYGHKFFTVAPGGFVSSCTETNQLASGASATYYGSTAGIPGSPLVFLNGYLIATSV